MGKEKKARRAGRVYRRSKRTIRQAHAGPDRNPVAGIVAAQKALNRPDHLNAGDIVPLQQAVGNRTVQRLLGRRPSATKSIHEASADRSQSTRQRRQRLNLMPGPVSLVQRVPGDPADILDQQAYERAKNEHDEDRAELHSIVSAASKHPTDIRLRNSAEWVMQGRPDMKLYALTPTHDAEARAHHHSVPDYRTFFSFPEGALYENGRLQPAVYYERDIDDSSHLNAKRADDAGFQRPGVGIAVISPKSRSALVEGYVQEVLRHEIQHAADLHESEGSRSDASMSTEMAIETYKTEYRAYSLEGSEFNDLSAIRRIRRHGFGWNERQYAIFKTIKDDYDNVTWAWDSNTNPKERSKFRKMVLSFSMPTSVNPLNSVRVDALNQYIKQRKPADFKLLKPDNSFLGVLKKGFQLIALARAKKRYKKLQNLVENLDAEERRSLMINPGARSFRLKKLGKYTNDKIEAMISVGMREGPIKPSEQYA